jgi:hypothetical protein
LASCYKVYDPHIDTSEKVLAVNGMITNKTNAYHILLTYANTVNSSGTGLPVSSAEVYVTDDLDNSYIFHERGIGDYMSDSLQFTGIPGRTYQLHITIPDGAEYESDPQPLFPEVYPDSVYAEFDSQETISKITGLKVISYGANILSDIRNESDTLPRFGFTTNLVTEYVFVDCPPFALCDIYYCWQTENANPNIDLTGGEYSTNSASVNKHAVCFIDDNLYCYSLIYLKPFMVSSRIIYLNQYTLNNEAYLYYKSLDEQIQSEGKLFDPIAAQLNGNIKCITNPEKKAIGFFEASSVSYTSYKVDFRNLVNAQPAITKIPFILPPEPKGYWKNKFPPFWVN